MDALGISEPGENAEAEMIIKVIIYFQYFHAMFGQCGIKIIDTKLNIFGLYLYLRFFHSKLFSTNKSLCNYMYCN